MPAPQAETVLAEADKHAKAADAALSAAREERARAQALSEAAADAHRGTARPASATSSNARRTNWPNAPRSRTARNCRRSNRPRSASRSSSRNASSWAASICAPKKKPPNRKRACTTLTADRDDLAGAIERLRRGIQSLNREGRERLLESFEKVNANFQELFTKLFEGGEAKLTFTESEDPLEAGLEIFARPPGKRLQSLALLSGGEQALTAHGADLRRVPGQSGAGLRAGRSGRAAGRRQCRALLQHARRDDANVADTRFLVITHHALTMSRMDRLFGVTMAERGVSQLVSVTLAEAEKSRGGIDSRNCASRISPRLRFSLSISAA